MGERQRGGLGIVFEQKSNDINNVLLIKILLSCCPFAACVVVVVVSLEKFAWLTCKYRLASRGEELIGIGIYLYTRAKMRVFGEGGSREEQMEK